MKIILKWDLDAHKYFYKLSGWTADDWMDADEFLSELVDSEADYQVIPKMVIEEKIKELLK